MNIKTKSGLALLDAILAENAWDKHYASFDAMFSNVDVDWINHMISTEINGEEIIDKYDTILENETMIKELSIIQNNINKMYS